MGIESSLDLLVHASRVSPELRQAVADVEREIELLRTVVREMGRHLTVDTSLTWMRHSPADEAYHRAFATVGMEPPTTRRADSPGEA